MRALAKLTWLELKIFTREPLGLIGTVLLLGGNASGHFEPRHLAGFAAAFICARFLVLKSCTILAT